jgi:hypothetical protein
LEEVVNWIARRLALHCFAEGRGIKGGRSPVISSQPMKGRQIRRTIITHILDGSCQPVAIGQTRSVPALFEMSKSVLIRHSDELSMTAQFDRGNNK